MWNLLPRSVKISCKYSKEIIRNFFRLVLHFNSPDVINVIGKCYSYNEKETKGEKKKKWRKDSIAKEKSGRARHSARRSVTWNILELRSRFSSSFTIDRAFLFLLSSGSSFHQDLREYRNINSQFQIEILANYEFNFFIHREFDSKFIDYRSELRIYRFKIFRF